MSHAGEELHALSEHAEGGKSVPVDIDIGAFQEGAHLPLPQPTNEWNFVSRFRSGIFFFSSVGTSCSKSFAKMETLYEHVTAAAYWVQATYVLLTLWITITINIAITPAETDVGATSAVAQRRLIPAKVPMTAISTTKVAESFITTSSEKTALLARAGKILLCHD